MDMWVKRKMKVYKRHHTKKLGTNRGGQSGQGQSDTDSYEKNKDRHRDLMDTEADRDGQKWEKGFKGTWRDLEGRTRTDTDGLAGKVRN
jgi:hypothetical protein